jgi:hypothetical protein
MRYGIDALKGCVILLIIIAHYQATNGSLTDIQTHMKGLERMVILRGELDVPNKVPQGINPYTKRLVLWYGQAYMFTSSS